MQIRLKIPYYDNHPKKEDIKNAVNQLEEKLNKALVLMNGWYPKVESNEISHRLKIESLEKFVVRSILNNQISELEKMAAAPTFLRNLTILYENIHSLNNYLKKPSKRSARILDQQLAQDILEFTWKSFNQSDNDSELENAAINNSIYFVSQIIKNTLDISKDPRNETHIAALNRNVNKLNDNASNSFELNMLTLSLTVLSSLLIVSVAFNIVPLIFLAATASLLNFGYLKITPSLDENHRNWLTPAYEKLNNLNNHYQPSRWDFWTGRNLRQHYLIEITSKEITHEDKSELSLTLGRLG